MSAERLDPVIHQQTRLQIMGALYRNHRASFTDLRDGLDLTAGNLAGHSARLEEAGYIKSQRVLAASGFEAQFVITRLGFAAFSAYLASLRGLLTDMGVEPSGLSPKQSTHETVSDAS